MTFEHINKSTCLVNFLGKWSWGLEASRGGFDLYFTWWRMFPLNNIISINVDIFGDINDITLKRLRGMFNIHFTLSQMFAHMKLPRDQLTLFVSQRSYKREQAGIGLVPPPLPCRTPAVCPLWKHTDVYIPIGWHHWTPVPCFSQKGTLVAHLLSAYISKLPCLYSLLQPGSDGWMLW